MHSSERRCTASVKDKKNDWLEVSYGKNHSLEFDSLPLNEGVSIRLRIDFGTNATFDDEDSSLLHVLRTRPWKKVKLCNSRSSASTKHLFACLDAVDKNQNIESLVLWRSNVKPEMLHLLPRQSKLGDVHLHPLPDGGWQVASRLVERALHSNQSLESLGLIRLSDTFLMCILQSLTGHKALNHLSVGLSRQFQYHQSMIVEAILQLKLVSSTYENFEFSSESITSAAMSGVDRLKFKRCSFTSRHDALNSTSSTELSLQGVLPINVCSLLKHSPRLRSLRVSIPLDSNGRLFLSRLFHALESSSIECLSFHGIDRRTAMCIEQHLPKWISVKEVNFTGSNGMYPSVEAFKRNSSIVRTNIDNAAIQWYTSQRNHKLRETMVKKGTDFLPRLLSISQSDLGATQVAEQLLRFPTRF